MAGHELAVEQGEAADDHPRDQPGERYLRRIGHPAEHGFAEEGTTKPHAVEAADQNPVVPAFDRVSVTRGVEAEGRALDVAVDPRLVAVGAGPHDLLEGEVASHREPARAQAAGERP